MNKYVVVMQNNIKSSSSTFLLFTVKLLVGLILGLTLALMGEVVFSYGTFLFAFIMITGASIFMSIAKNWSFLGVAIFSVFCVMCGLLLRMYALIAPAQ